jgi:hypothetical protein
VLRGDQLAAMVACSGGYFSDPANPSMFGIFSTFISWPSLDTTHLYPQDFSGAPTWPGDVSVVRETADGLSRVLRVSTTDVICSEKHTVPEFRRCAYGIEAQTQM